jgi:hypothetical protein
VNIATSKSINTSCIQWNHYRCLGKQHTIHRCGQMQSTLSLQFNSLS